MDILNPGYFLDPNFAIDKSKVPTKVSTKTGLKADHIDQYAIELYEADQPGGGGRPKGTHSINENCKTGTRFITWQTDIVGPIDPLLKRRCVLNKHRQRWIPNIKCPIYLHRVLLDTKILLYDVVKNPDKYNNVNVVTNYRQLIDEHIKPIYCGANVSEEYLDDAQLATILVELRLHQQHQQGIATLHQQHEQGMATLHQQHQQGMATLTSLQQQNEQGIATLTSRMDAVDGRRGVEEEEEEAEDGDIDDTLDAFNDAAAEEEDVETGNDGDITFYDAVAELVVEPTDVEEPGSASTNVAEDSGNDDDDDVVFYDTVTVLVVEPTEEEEPEPEPAATYVWFAWFNTIAELFVCAVGLYYIGSLLNSSSQQPRPYPVTYSSPYTLNNATVDPRLVYFGCGPYYNHDSYSFNLVCLDWGNRDRNVLSLDINAGLNTSIAAEPLLQAVIELLPLPLPEVVDKVPDASDSSGEVSDTIGGGIVNGGGLFAHYKDGCGWIMDTSIRTFQQLFTTGI